MVMQNPGKIIKVMFVSGIIVIFCSVVFAENTDRATLHHEKITEKLLSEIDDTVQPCDNFYEFACGNYIKNSSKPAPDSQIDKFLTTSAFVVADVHSVVQNLPSTNTFKPFTIVKNFYDSCMNTKKITAQGNEPLIKILKDLDGWPLMDSQSTTSLFHWKELITEMRIKKFGQNNYNKGDRSNKKMFQWEKLIAKIRNLGYTGDYLIGMYINPHPENTTKLVVHLNEPELEFSHEQFMRGVNDRGVQAYYAFMVDVAVLLGVQREQAKKEFWDVLSFEMQLSDIMQFHNANEYQKFMKFKDLSRQWPLIDWYTLINKVLRQFVTLNSNEEVIITNPTFVAALENLMNRTPLIIQKNYILWKVIYASVPYLNYKMQKKLLIYNTARYGTFNRRIRWATCITNVKKELKLAVDSLYIRNFVKNDTKERISDMINDIKDELFNGMNKAKWLHANARSNTKNLINNMISFIAYADEFRDDKKLEIYYRGLEVDSGNYLQNLLDIRQFMMKKNCRNLKTPFNYSDWTILDSWMTVNARYIPHANQLEIPAGILRYPFYASNRPNYMNYGSIGSIIGYELFHMFDDSAKIFGESNQVLDRKTKFAKYHYLTKLLCITRQYNSYEFDDSGHTIDGTISQHENIADAGGARIAYLAYQKWVSQHGNESMLPNLPYTPNQLFWISMANTWCTVYGSRALETVSSQQHTLNEFRVIGTLSNIPEFSADFNCPIDARMNPLKKCECW